MQNLIERKFDFAPKFGPIGLSAAKRSYFKEKKLSIYHQDTSEAQENWEEMCYRVVMGNFNFVPFSFDKKEAQELYEAMLNMQIMPGGRHFSNTGITNREYIGNCYASFWDWVRESDHFTFSFERAMEGGGLGCNYSDIFFENAGTFLCPKIDFVSDSSHADFLEMRACGVKDKTAFLSQLTEKRDIFVIPDSREGWSKALDIFIINILVKPKDIIFDFSNIRKKGMKLKTTGGYASGPAPFVNTLNNMYLHCKENVGKKFDWWDGFIFDHYLSECVMSGGFRRVARLAMKYWKDPGIFKFIDSKKNGSAIWTANISVGVDEAFFQAVNDGDVFATEVLNRTLEAMRCNGEPGFINIDKAKSGEKNFFSMNACGELALEPAEFCNLGHLNLSRIEENDIFRLARLVTRMLLRANFSPLNPESRKITDENMRIAVGFMGLQFFSCKKGIKYSEISKHPFFKIFFNNLYDYVRKEADLYCREVLKCNTPIKVTTIAPTGTVGQICGATTGCQSIIYKYFMRRMRISEGDPVLDEYRRAGYIIEVDAMEPRLGRIICIPMRDPLLSYFPDEIIEDQTEISMQDALELQVFLQENWSDNSISFTMNFDPREISFEDFKENILTYLPRLKGTTVLPNNHNFKQPPYTKLTKEEYMEEISKLKYFVHQEDGAEVVCHNGSCELIA